MRDHRSCCLLFIEKEKLPGYVLQIYLKLQCKCNPKIINVNLPCFFFSKSVAEHMKETILRYPVKTASKGMKQRVELSRYLGYRRLRCHNAQRSMVVCLHSRLRQFRRHFQKKKTPTKNNYLRIVQTIAHPFSV